MINGFCRLNLDMAPRNTTKNLLYEQNAKHVPDHVCRHTLHTLHIFKTQKNILSSIAVNVKLFCYTQTGR